MQWGWRVDCVIIMLAGRCYDKKRKRTRQEDHWERRRREQGCWRWWFAVVLKRMVKTASLEKVKLGKDEMRDPSNRESHSLEPGQSKRRKETSGAGALS